MTTSDITVFYHANCIDGFGSALIAKIYFEEKEQLTDIKYNIEYIPVKYNEEPLWGKILNRDVYILDFSYPEKEMFEIYNMCDKLVLLDHHKTAIERLTLFDKHVANECANDNNGSYIRLDSSYSGAGLSWNYFFLTKEMPMFVRHIQDHDLYKLEYPETKAFTRYLSSLPFDFNVWEAYYQTTYCVLNSKNVCQHYQNILSQGRAQENLFNQLCDKIIQEAVEINFNSFKGFMVNANPQFASNIGHILAKKEGSNFGLTYFIDKDRNYIFSIRSIGDFDVAKIAETFKGGGHKNAAGFKMFPDVAQDFITTLIDDVKK